MIEFCAAQREHCDKKVPPPPSLTGTETMTKLLAFSIHCFAGEPFHSGTRTVSSSSVDNWIPKIKIHTYTWTLETERKKNWFFRRRQKCFFFIVSTRQRVRSALAHTQSHTLAYSGRKTCVCVCECSFKWKPDSSKKNETCTDNINVQTS